MSDMWAAASKDIEAERKEKATAMAAVALGKFAPFLFEAKTKSEFTTRMALQQTKIAEALQDLSLIHISEPTRRLRGSRMPSSA